MISDKIKEFIRTFSEGLSAERRLALICVENKWAVVMTPPGDPTNKEQFAEVNANFGTLVQGLMVLNPGVDQKDLIRGYLRQLCVRAYQSDPTLFVEESKVGSSQALTAFETSDLAIVWYGLFNTYRAETFLGESVPNAIAVVISGDEANPHTLIKPFVTSSRKPMITAEAAAKAAGDPVTNFANAIINGVKTDYPQEWGGLLYVYEETVGEPEANVKELRGVMLLPAARDPEPLAAARDVSLLKELLLGNADVSKLDGPQRLSLFIRTVGALLDDWVTKRVNEHQNIEALKKSPVIFIRTRMVTIILEAIDLFGPALMHQIGTISGYMTLANVGGLYRTVENGVLRYAATPEVIDGCGPALEVAVRAMAQQLEITAEDDAKFIYIPDSETTEITLASFGEAAQKALEFSRSAATDELNNKPGRAGEFLTALYAQIRGSVDVEKVPPQEDSHRFVGALHAGPTLVWDLLDRLYGAHIPSTIKSANTVAIIKGTDDIVRFVFTRVKF